MLSFPQQRTMTAVVVAGRIVEVAPVLPNETLVERNHWLRAEPVLFPMSSSRNVICASAPAVHPSAPSSPKASETSSRNHAPRRPFQTATFIGKFPP